MPIKVVWSSRSPNSTQAIPGKIQMSPMEANTNIVCFFFLSGQEIMPNRARSSIRSVMGVEEWKLLNQQLITHNSVHDGGHL